jgi:hypothetical protein
MKDDVKDLCSKLSIRLINATDLFIIECIPDKEKSINLFDIVFNTYLQTSKHILLDIAGENKDGIATVNNIFNVINESLMKNKLFKYGNIDTNEEKN